ncbi:hypothetical protein NAI57_11980, partial [Francisella tularensis subsp. holarctica]|nr:hypothetical protein [Francisella tularensis subsp. holarctica]
TMTQAEIDKLYTKPIVFSSKQYTFNLELPVDSIDCYRWFLISPDYDYIYDDSYSDESVDIQNSKWGGLDNFKLILS